MATRRIYGPRGGPKVELEGPLTDAEREARDDMIDRIRGGPKSRIRDLATQCEMTYAEFMEKITEYLASDGDRWDHAIHLGIDSPDIGSLWDDYELITGKVVPQDKRGSPFTCAC